MKEIILIQLLSESLKCVAAESNKLNLFHINEQAVAFRIGCHLFKLLENYESENLYLDSEYSIDPSGDSKRLAVYDQLREKALELKRTIKDDKIRVRPDFIIHSRNTNSKNVAVIELKFEDASDAEFKFVTEKLFAFSKEPFGYKLKILIVVPRNWELFSSMKNIRTIQ